MQLFWSHLKSPYEYLLGKEEDKNADTFTTFSDDFFLVTHAIKKSHFVIIKNSLEFPKSLPLVKVKEAAEILIESMEWSCFPTIFVYAKLREIKMNRDFCLSKTDGWRSLRVNSPTAKMWNSFSCLENKTGSDKSSDLKRFSVSKHESEKEKEDGRQNLDCGPSESLNATNLIDFESMLMMQPSPEKKIKEEIEEIFEQEIKIEIEEEETVISDGELKEVKTEPIDEDEFEVKSPLFEQKINSPKEPKVKSTSELVPKHKLYKRKCSACLKKEEYSSVKNVTTKSERMLVFLGMILDGQMSVDEANSRYTKSIDSYMCICRRHFHESRRYLYNALGVTTADQIFYADAKIVENILETVKLIQEAPMTNVQFVQALEKFAEKDSSAELRKIEWKRPRTNRAGKCCYCQKSCKQSEMSRVPKSEDLRLEWIRLLGADFKKNIRSINWPYICRSHLPPNSFSPSGRLLKGVLPCIN